VEATNQAHVLLEDELKFTANYVALQKIRFAHGFDYHIHVQVDDLYSRCLPFSIQTLVENVFCHNELSSARPVAVAVTVHQVADRLVVEVVNSVSTPVDNAGSGVGLRNLQERLQLLYGGSATLATQLLAEGFFAKITFPTRAGHD
jgi:LytS/YehU family sensor histidine kinase